MTLQRIQRFAATLGTIRNVPLIFLSRRFGFRIGKVTLWNGAVFYVENANNNLGTILEVFHDKEYIDLLQVKNSTPTIIDIGSNIGTFTVWALRHYPQGKVIACEPEKGNFALLTKNIQANSFSDRVVPLLTAVAGSPGERVLSVAGESSGKNSLSYSLPNSAAVAVPATTLDEIFKTHSIESCDCLKVDCEGAEYEILYATSDVTLGKIERIILEWHPVEGHSKDALCEFLQSKNFTVTHSTRFSNMVTAVRRD